MVQRRQARQMQPAQAAYRGVRTTPERWNGWSPSEGDVIVCTPAKCGTTWTQAIVAMLLSGSVQLPAALTDMSPWIDSNLADEVDVRRALDGQTGRRVVKTHTPAEGFPVWSGVTLIAVYRHPLDVFLSIRNHVANRPTIGADHPMRAKEFDALGHFLNTPLDRDNIDTVSLSVLVHHYTTTVQLRRWSDLVVMHYADMIADHRGTVERIAKSLGIETSPTLIDAVCDATSFAKMKSAAEQYTPGGGQGFWRDKKAFFNSGRANTWRGQLSAAAIESYNARFEEIAPDSATREWLESGSGA